MKVDYSNRQNVAYQKVKPGRTVRSPIARRVLASTIGQGLPGREKGKKATQDEINALAVLEFQKRKAALVAQRGGSRRCPGGCSK